jgi:hypothetical protein
VAAPTKPTPQRRTYTDTNGEPVQDSAMASASRIHAVTSFTAAAGMAMRPRSVVRSLSSARMRTSTGNAVMESATPMNTTSGPRDASGHTAARSATEAPTPSENGRGMPATAMARAVRPMRRSEDGSSSRPTRNRKKSRPMLASVSSTVRFSSGNTMLWTTLFRPSADGPRRMPPYIH